MRRAADGYRLRRVFSRIDHIGVAVAEIEPAVDENAGRIVKTIGDGLLLEFGSAVDAVRFALQVQQGVRERPGHAILLLQTAGEGAR